MALTIRPSVLWTFKTLVMYMENLVKFLLASVLIFLSSFTMAGGWTTPGNIENVEIIRAQGFLVTGAFGSAIGCDNAVTNKLWVAIDHPQYDQLYSTVLAAYMGNKKIRAYAHTCTEIGWHGGHLAP